MSTDKYKEFIKPPHSYWMASTPGTEYPSLNEDLKVDVAIIGGGITGILCASLLIQKGVKVAIIEADRILQGTTGHTTAKITSQHGLIYSKIKNQISEELARQYADANETAIRTIEKMVKENNIECDFKAQSAYVYTLQDEYVNKIRDEADTAASIGIKADSLEKIPLGFPIKAAVRFDNQAQFHPRKFLLAKAKEITKNGGLIFEQSRVVNIEEDGNYVLVTHHGKKVSAKKVIIASHYPFYNK
ncbi:MAG: FAD-dependent oxidoreductase, partial [Bacillota bacterium]|nr:FAD-dependent oxidoreductase [Bacillota bacterium]